MKKIKTAFYLGFEAGCADGNPGNVGHKWDLNKYFFEDAPSQEQQNAATEPQQPQLAIALLDRLLATYGKFSRKDVPDALFETLTEWRSATASVR